MNEFEYLRKLGDEVERLRQLEALLPEICQLIDACRTDWIARDCWSAWDQSVRDRITAYNLLKRSQVQGGLSTNNEEMK
jgi:hypothetical protein